MWFLEPSLQPDSDSGISYLFGGAFLFNRHLVALAYSLISGRKNEMARVDVLPHLLLNVRWNDNLLRFTVGHAIVRPGRHQQHGVRHRCDGAVADNIGLRSDLPGIIDPARR